MYILVTKQHCLGPPGVATGIKVSHILTEWINTCHHKRAPVLEKPSSITVIVYMCM